ncbi:hypothetical protein H2204_011014 [Knufia peltigerae]|uniref:Isochorismatase-like domain-containing protein n=1 Tax=Knufia peltigerae TaxID=1002370 RepID=A0AA39CS90_9EURO|nr:hypothetical protein H2204_011014 [Knufia peltigerae]
MTASTVLLLLDIQNGIVERAGMTQSYLDAVSQTLKAARAAHVQVIHVLTAFRPGYPEASSRNGTKERIASWGDGVFIEGHPSTQLHPVTTPVEGEMVVTKRRVSAFHGTDLDLILRSIGAETLVIAGLITSGAVLSAVRQAADLDYKQIVLEDLCADPDAEVHDLLVKKVLSKQATVMSLSEWTAGLGKD